MFFFQATEKSFGIRNTGLTAVEIVLLAFLGNRLHDSVFTGHNISAVAARMTRHLAFCFADIHYVVIETQGCVLNHFLIPMTPCQREVLSNSAYGIFCFPSQHARDHLPWRIQLGQVV